MSRGYFTKVFAPARVAPDTTPEIDSLSASPFLFVARVVALLLLLLLDGGWFGSSISCDADDELVVDIEAIMETEANFRNFDRDSDAD